jgi:hypothetical protein
MVDDASVSIAGVREDAATLGFQAVEAALFTDAGTCRGIKEGEGAVPSLQVAPARLTAARPIAKDPVENRSLILRVFLPFVVGYYQSAPMVTTNPVNPYAGYIAEASRRFGIPERWIRAVMRVESRGQVKAVSPKGAIGLMQIMPDTWAGLRLRYRLGRNPQDPHDKHSGGCGLLARDARSLRRGGLSRRLPGPLCGIYCDRPPVARGNSRLCRSPCAIDWRRSGQPRRRHRSRGHRMDTCPALRCGCRQHLIRISAAIRRSIARTFGRGSLRA